MCQNFGSSQASAIEPSGWTVATKACAGLVPSGCAVASNISPRLVLLVIGDRGAEGDGASIALNVTTPVGLRASRIPLLTERVLATLRLKQNFHISIVCMIATHHTNTATAHDKNIRPFAFCGRTKRDPRFTYTRWAD